MVETEQLPMASHKHLDKYEHEIQQLLEEPSAEDVRFADGRLESGVTDSTLVDFNSLRVVMDHVIKQL